MDNSNTDTPAWQALAFEMFFAPTMPYMATVALWLRDRGFADATDERVKAVLRAEQIARSPRGLPSVMRMVFKGSVRLFAQDYTAPELMPFEQTRVFVSYDTLDMKTVVVSAGSPPRFVCEAALVCAAPATITDTCQLDVMVDGGDGHTYRPALTVTADRASGAVLGWQIGAPQAVRLEDWQGHPGNPRSKGAVESFFREFAKTLPQPASQPLTLRALVDRARAFFSVRSNILKRMG